MKFCLSLLLLATSASAQPEKRIVGGSTAALKQFPYQVSVQTSSHRCGGSIIDLSHVLTAAQCVDGLQASRIRVRAGSSQHSSGGKLVNVAKVIQHPDFDNETLKNDIAVLVLQHNLEFGASVSAVKLPSSEVDTPAIGAKCSITGWGTTSYGGNIYPTNLLVSYLNIVDHEVCAKDYSARRNIDDSMICAGVSAGGKGACDGDTGGPLVEESSTKQVGIFSRSHGCGQAAYPGIYTSTAAHSAWIREAISP
ncbi:unnamed protein product [Penicillium egyptiacum]|uniref:Peptidase S1 domain-containing protein n=1 Tax=Penicillium egyptiacum TaxID=1303716 RepID=A0A9W4K658_9EURO|nr:unnamed protein product [Penicillium egyptiacum]